MPIRSGGLRNIPEPRGRPSIVERKTGVLVQAEFADDETTALLLDLLHEERSRLDRDRLLALSADGWVRLLSLTAEQRVRPLLYQRLKEEGLAERIPAVVRSELHDRSMRVALRTLHFYGETARIAASLEAENVDVMVLKGVHLAASVYGDASLRGMLDMDLMVRSEHLARAEAALRALGYSPEKRTDIDVSTAVMHHLPPFVDGRGRVEVHWNLTRPGLDISIDPAGLWERAGEIEIAGQRVMALSVEDLLLHLCQHASYHHDFLPGLYPLCDIAATIRRFGSAIDWTAVCLRAEAWGWQRGVYLCLYLARDLVGAAVPEDVLQRLRPAGIGDDVVEAARYLIFVPRRVGGAISRSVVGLSGDRPPWQKLQLLWRRIFLSPSHVASIYALPRHSPWIPLYYFVRIKDMILNHGAVLVRSSGRSASLTRTARRRDVLLRWLAARTEGDDQSRRSARDALATHRGA